MTAVDRARRLLQLKLSSFEDGSEQRSQAVTILLLAGLKHYGILYPKQPLQLELLMGLCDKYVNELAAELKPVTSARVNRPERSYAEAAQAMNRGNGRRYRPDAMAHFPFADEAGSVPAALESAAHTPAVNLLDMGVPGRDRRIKTVFEEMRFAGSGIRLSDIPEALERLGISVGPALRRTLERTRSSLVDGPITARVDEDDQKLLQYMEKHVPFAAWKTIVKNFLRHMSEGIEPSRISDILPVIGTESRPARRSGDRGAGADGWANEPDSLDNAGADVEDAESGGFGEAAEETKQQQSQENFDDIEDFEDDLSDVPAQPAARQRLRRGKPTKGSGRDGRWRDSRRSGVEVINQQTRNYFRNVRSVPSRLGTIIRDDRQRHQTGQRQTDNRAVQSIARRRVDILTATAPPLGFRDPNYFSEPTLGATSRARRAASAADTRSDRWAEIQQQKQHRRRLQDLGSGTAALEIADSFLHGSVGREILLWADRANGGQSDAAQRERSWLEGTGDLNPQEAQWRAVEMLGLQNVAGQRAPSATSRTTTAAAIPSATSSSTLRGQGSGKSEQQTDEEARRLYAAGWRSNKGGWAADFGPAHTKALYTGPERLASRRVRSTKDFASAILGRRSANDLAVAAAATSATSIGKEDTEEDSLQNMGAVRDPMLQTFARDVMSMRSSDRSTTDSAVAGAGAGAAFDDDDLDGMHDFIYDFEDELLGRLQESVALKDVAAAKRGRATSST